MPKQDIPQDRIQRVDKHRLYKVFEAWPRSAKAASGLPVIVQRESYDRVIFLAMGGSATCGDIISDWLTPSDRLEFTVFKGVLPRVRLSHTLVIACSASGNTQETVEAAKKAYGQGARMITISSGGRLESFSKSNGIPHVKIPLRAASRFTFPYLLFSSLAILKGVGLISEFHYEIPDAISKMYSLARRISTATPAARNPAKKLALVLRGARPKIYGTSMTRGVALRFKASLNENAKTHAYADCSPELFHNEIESWSGKENDFALIFLRHSKDPASERKRMDEIIERLSDRGLTIHQVRGLGKSALGQLATLVYHLDFSSYYLAIIKGVDPLPTPLVNGLKGSS